MRGNGGAEQRRGRAAGNRGHRGVSEGLGGVRTRAYVQRVMDPGAAGVCYDLDDEPDGCVVLRWLRGLLEMLSPAGSEG